MFNRAASADAGAPLLWGVLSDRPRWSPAGRGGRNCGPPTKTFFPLIDRITALHAPIGALAALHERKLSGRGQTIDVSLADSGFTANEIPIAAYLADGTVVQREGNGRGLTNAYRTTDGWALLHATSDAIWPRVCEAMEWTEWGADQDLASKRGREKRGEEIGRALEDWFARRTTRDAVDHLSRFSVPAAPVNSIENAAEDPHVHEREILVEVPDPYAGSIHVSGKTIKFGRTPMEVGTAPTVGEHTEHVLRDILGYSSERLNDLVTGNVVATSGPGPTQSNSA